MVSSVARFFLIMNTLSLLLVTQAGASPAAAKIELQENQSGADENTAMKSQVSVQSMRSLFPGPLQFENGPPVRLAPFHEPDPLVLDLLAGMDHQMQDVVLPRLHETDSASLAPNSCDKDLKAHCSDARSQVHCLGQHSVDISDQCRKDVGKSVPFLCSKPIDRFCDLMKMGILDCLSERIKDLGSDCADSVLATRQVIKHASFILARSPLVPFGHGGSSKDAFILARSPLVPFGHVGRSEDASILARSPLVPFGHGGSSEDAIILARSPLVPFGHGGSSEDVRTNSSQPLPSPEAARLPPVFVASAAVTASGHSLPFLQLCIVGFAFLVMLLTNSCCCCEMPLLRFLARGRSPEGKPLLPVAM